MRRAVVWLLATLTPSAWSQSIYKVYEIGPAGGTDIQVNGLNNHDQVCGYATLNGTGRYFVGTLDGGYTYLDAPDGFYMSQLNGINDAGWVAGTVYQKSGGRSQGCVWDPNGAYTLTGWISGIDHSLMYGINNWQHACGDAHQNSGNSGMALRWTASLGLIPLQLLSGFTSATGYSILDDDSVYGVSDTQSSSVATRWEPSGFAHLLQPLAGEPQSSLSMANAAGVAVGESYGSNTELPTKWVDDEPVEMPRLPGTPMGALGCMDSIGNAVGACGSAIQAVACYWPSSGGVVDLNTRVDPSTPGWILQYGKLINDNGVIVGVGTHNGREYVHFIALPTTDSPVAVQDVTINLGTIRLGDYHSLSTIDGDTLQVALFLVPTSRPQIQFSVTGMDPYNSLSSLKFVTYSKMAKSGSFAQTLGLYNFQLGDYDPVDTRTDVIGTSYRQTDLLASGDAGRYRRADGLIRSRITVTQVGPSSSSNWWNVTDMAQWRVRP